MSRIRGKDTKPEQKSEVRSQKSGVRTINAFNGFNDFNAGFTKAVKTPPLRKATKPSGGKSLIATSPTIKNTPEN
jgi:hypothetical protein